MSATYYLWLIDPRGRRVEFVRSVVELEATLPVNAPAVLSIVAKPTPLLRRAVVEEGWRLECYRKPAGRRAYLLHQSQFVVRRGRDYEPRRGSPLISLTAKSGEDLLADRIVAYAANSSEAAKSGQAIDAMMVEIVDENLGAAAAAERQLSLLSIAPAAGTGPSTSRAFSRQNVLSVLQGLAEEAAQLGTPVFFAVPWAGTGWRFETYVGLRGVDHTQRSGTNPVVFSAAAGTLSNPSVEVDRSDERSVIYAGGTGVEESRIVESATDAARVGTSQIGWREGWRDARNGGSTSAYVQAEARSELRARRGRRIFTGEITDADGFDRRWRLGDLVTAEHNEQFDCRVDLVRVRYQRRTETVTASLRAEELL